MERLQVQLTENQLQALRHLSATNGKSISELIRRGVDLYLAGLQHSNREQQIERALRVAGKFSSGSSDGSAQHDRHLADAFRG